MKVLVTGATGLVGRHVVAAAREAGHEVVPASRRPGHEVVGLPTVAWPGGPLPDDLDGVVHLAGASIGGRRWSRPYKRTLVESRVATALALAEALPEDARFVAASAVGYYGIAPQRPCLEETPPGDDFLASLCVAWENAAQQATGACVRLRFGHVLARDDGLLGRLAPLHRARLAGIIGNGRQELPWIHVDDLAHLVVAALESDVTGPVNAVAGNVRYQDLHRALCRRIGGLERLRIPNVALKIRLGEFAKYLLGGQHVVARRLDELGFSPRFRDLDAALDDLYP